MSDYIKGLLVQAGTPYKPDDYVGVCRVVVRCKTEDLKSVKRLPMHEECAVVPVAELTALQAGMERLRGDLADAHQRAKRAEAVLREIAKLPDPIAADLASAAIDAAKGGATKAASDMTDRG